MSTFWSIWVSAITIGTLIGCAVLLRWCFKDRTGVEEGHDMGHEYDGIRELNNPLPKWWTYLFISTIVFAAVYLALYPTLATLKAYSVGQVQTKKFAVSKSLALQSLRLKQTNN